MNRESAGVKDAEPRQPVVRASPRFLIAGAAAVSVLLVVIAVLAFRLSSAGPAAAGPATTPTPSPSAAASLTAAAIYQRVGPSVVVIRAGHDLGSGVIVADNGTIVTADHVIAGGGAITVTFADGTTARATVASADKKLDIATLTPATLPKVVVSATLGGRPAVGAPVVAIGNPLGLTYSVSAGIVSGLNRDADTDTGERTGLIQFDASVNPGSSGGPLLDQRGLVIGIVVALAEPDGEDAFAGIGFAVPIGTALGGGGRGGAPDKVPQI